MSKSFCGKSCDKCINKKQGLCIGCSMCEINFCNCSKDKKNRCFVRCPRKFGSNIIIQDLVKKNQNKNIMSNKKLELPLFIPVMPDRVRTIFDFSKTNGYIAVHGEFLLSANGEDITPIYRKRGYKSALGLNEKNIKGIAEFYIKDRTLEGFWNNRKVIYEQLKKQNFTAVITPNFSLYEDAPRQEHLYNIQRVKTIYNEMISEGLPAVLDVVWAEEEDLNYWIKEIKNSGIKTVAFSFMSVGLKASNSWRHYALAYKILVSSLEPDVDIIVAGLSSNKRIATILELSKGRRVSIMHQAAWVKSRKGFLESENKQVDRSISKDKIFQMNLEYYADSYKEFV